MKPKEKAIELVEKFKIDNYDWIAQSSNVTAKKSAWIAVDLIIEQLTPIEKAPNNKNAFGYWQKVKIEIKNL